MSADLAYVPQQVVTSVEEVDAILGEQFESQVNKVIDHIDDHCRVWIERSPFVVVASASASGAMDVSPKGDPPGFVRVLDPKTLAIPDRPGNHRIDTFRNVLDNPQIGLMFVVPNPREVVRVSGTAVVVEYAALLESMPVGGRVPSLAIVVHVQEAMFHCGKSMMRRVTAGGRARPVTAGRDALPGAGRCAA
ncbi:MAG: MSMEG_1061 family FMN-dependent PPOX-type flavoprotein [Jatrophihabitans sp.]|uniref:MSMEG_1061 family FMN-dependent PPOX-type flavoprotein n=1 Tax=Jatrophihabitans sp. TaxID=1932789 RepID=UPI003916A138